VLGPLFLDMPEQPGAVRASRYGQRGYHHP
jgi:hypothetical protein